MSELKPLPDPFDYCYEWDSPFGTVRKFSQAPHNGQGPDRSVTLFTADQMHAYALENRRAQPAAPSVAPEPVAWTTLIEIDWVKRNAGRAGSFYAVKAGPNDIPLFAHPPRAPSVAPEPPKQVSDSYAFIKRTNEEYRAWCRTYYSPDALESNDMVSLHGLWAWQEQERRKEATHPPRAPLTEGALMGIYMEFDRHADKAWTSAEYLLRFAAAVDAHGIRGQG